MATHRARLWCGEVWEAVTFFCEAVMPAKKVAEHEHERLDAAWLAPHTHSSPLFVSTCTMCPRTCCVSTRCGSRCGSGPAGAAASGGVSAARRAAAARTCCGLAPHTHTESLFVSANCQGKISNQSCSDK